MPGKPEGKKIATGTKGGLLNAEPLQSYLKHQLLSRYIIQFVQKLAHGTDDPFMPECGAALEIPGFGLPGNLGTILLQHQTPNYTIQPT